MRLHHVRDPLARHERIGRIEHGAQRRIGAVRLDHGEVVELGEGVAVQEPDRSLSSKALISQRLRPSVTSAQSGAEQPGRNLRTNSTITAQTRGKTRSLH
jgi:hypothetical protein